MESLNKKQEGVTPEIKEKMKETARIIADINSIMRGRGEKRKRITVGAVKEGGSGNMIKERDNNYEESREYKNFQKIKTNKLKKSTDEPVNKLLNDIYNKSIENSNKSKKIEYSSEIENRTKEVELGHKETKTEVDHFEEAKKRITDSINESANKITKKYKEKDEEDRAKELTTNESNNDEVKKENTRVEPVVSVLNGVEKEKAGEKTPATIEETIEKIKIEIGEEENYKKEIKWWDLQEKKYQGYKLEHLKRKLEEAKEINLDRKEKPFLYFVLEKSSNQILLENNTNETTGLLDLRKIQKDWTNIEYRSLQKTGDNEGYFEYNIFGLVKIVKNVDKIRSKDGINIYSEEAIYKIIGPGGEIIADNIKGYQEATKIFTEKNKELEEKLTKEYGEVSDNTKTPSGVSTKENDQTQKEIKEPFKIGTQTFENEAELHKYLDENAVDKENNINLSFFDYTESNWPEPKTISAINEWTKNFKAKKREINKQNEPSEKEVTNDNKDNIAEEKIKEFDNLEQEQKNEKQEDEISPEKIKNLELLLGDIEKERIDKLEDGPLSSRLMGGVLKGLDKWENFGKGEEGPKGFAKRFAKMAVNLALIGAISSVSVEKLAELGVGTASALSGGVTSYLGRKMAVGLGIGSAMEIGGGKIPDKVKKWMPIALGVAGVGAAFVLSGGFAGLAAGAGYATSKLVKEKFTKEKIAERKEASIKDLLEKYKEKDGTVNLNRISEIEKDYEKLLKKYENQGIWGKLAGLGTGIITSAIALETSGLVRDAIHHQETESEQHHISEGTEKQEPSQPNVENKTEPTPAIEHKSINVEFSSRGGIQTILNMKEQIHNEYPDISKAPTSVQEFMNTNSTQEAIKLGFYNPNNPSGAESMMVLKGSTLEFDQHGNLSFHDIKTDEIHTLIETKGGAETIEKYQGKMFDSDHSEVKTENINSIYEPSNGYKIPEQFNPIADEEVNIQTEPISSVDNLYKLPPQVDPVTGEIVIKGNTDINNTNLNTEKVETTNSNEIINTQHNINLSTEELAVVHETLKENINHIFPENERTHAWDNVKDKTPDDLFKIEKENGLNEMYKPLTSHLHRLEEATGLRPRGASILNPIPETNREFIERALQKAQEMGQLDKVKL